jgi:hypothetical protein
MRSFLDEWLADFRSAVPLVAFVALSLIGALAGPFGTYELFPFLPRLLLWSLVVAVAIVAGTAIRAFVHAVLGLQRFWPGSVLIAVLVTLLFLPPLLALVEPVFAAAPLLKPGAAELAGFVFCCSLAVGAYRHAIGLVGRTRPRRQPEAAPPQPPQPGPASGPLPGPTAAAEPDPPAPAPPLRLLRRLPGTAPGRLIALSVRDHYVDVVTEGGRASLLMRLGDAIDEAEGEAGLRVHRSHWVALWAVRRIDRGPGGRVSLHLASGQCLPVARAQVARVAAALKGRLSGPLPASGPGPDPDPDPGGKPPPTSKA